jgi:uncharacterized protein
MTTGHAQVVVRNNPAELRYELVVDGHVAGEILYRTTRDAVALVHTEVSPALEGQGLASQLVSAALDDIRGRGLRVIPICPFVRAYIRRHAGVRHDHRLRGCCRGRGRNGLRPTRRNGIVLRAVNHFAPLRAGVVFAATGGRARRSA